MTPSKRSGRIELTSLGDWSDISDVFSLYEFELHDKIVMHFWVYVAEVVSVGIKVVFFWALVYMDIDNGAGGAADDEGIVGYAFGLELFECPEYIANGRMWLSVLRVECVCVCVFVLGFFGVF